MSRLHPYYTYSYRTYYFSVIAYSKNTDKDTDVGESPAYISHDLQYHSCVLSWFPLVCIKHFKKPWLQLKVSLQASRVPPQLEQTLLNTCRPSLMAKSLHPFHLSQYSLCTLFFNSCTCSCLFKNTCLSEAWHRSLCVSLCPAYIFPSNCSALFLSSSVLYLVSSHQTMNTNCSVMDFLHLITSPTVLFSPSLYIFIRSLILVLWQQTSSKSVWLIYDPMWPPSCPFLLHPPPSAILIYSNV